MTISTTAPPTAGIAAGFTALGAFLEENPAVSDRIRSCRIVNIPLDGKTSETRVAELYAIAREMDAVVEWTGSCFKAERQFGPVILEAHHNPASFWRVQDAAKRAAS